MKPGEIRRRHSEATKPRSKSAIFSPKPFASPLLPRAQIPLATPRAQPLLRPFNQLETTMARICAVTGRRPVKGSIINRKGQSKKSGGIGTHVTSITKRKFRPNLQRIRIKTANGGTKRVWVSVKAIKAGLVEKA